jgi:hypothetical protein
LYPAILLTVPYMTLVIDMYFGILRSSIFITAIQIISLFCIASYPTVNCLVTIYYVSPYRLTVVDICKRILASGEGMLRVRSGTWGSRHFLDEEEMGKWMQAGRRGSGAVL